MAVMVVAAWNALSVLLAAGADSVITPCVSYVAGAGMDHGQPIA